MKGEGASCKDFHLHKHRKTNLSFKFTLPSTAQSLFQEQIFLYWFLFLLYLELILSSIKCFSCSVKCSNATLQGWIAQREKMDGGLCTRVWAAISELHTYGKKCNMFSSPWKGLTQTSQGQSLK